MEYIIYKRCLLVFVTLRKTSKVLKALGFLRNRDADGEKVSYA